MSREVYVGGAIIVEDAVVYVDIPLLLKRLGMPDTPANRDMTVQACLEVAQEMMPGVPMYVVSLQ